MSTGPGGSSWSTAAEIEVGYLSWPTDISGYGDQKWWKFTPTRTETIAFDTSHSEFDETVPIANRDIRVNIYSGTESDSNFEASAEYVERLGIANYVGRGTLAVTAGVEYHAVVTPYNGVTELFFSISRVTDGDWIQPPNDVLTGDLNQSAGTPAHPGDTTRTNGLSYEGDYRPDPFPENPSPGTVSEADLRAFAEDAANHVPAASVIAAANVANGEIVIQAANYTVGIEFSPYHSSFAAFRYNGGGFCLDWRNQPYQWTKRTNEWDVPAFGIEYEGSGQTTYLFTDLELGAYIYNQGWDEDTDQAITPCTIDLHISPSSAPGTGRLIDTLVSDGPLLGVGALVGSSHVGHTNAQLRSHVVTVRVEPADYANADHVAYLVAQRPVKTGSIVGQHLGTSPNDRILNYLEYYWRDPGNGITAGLRHDSFLPPRYRYQYAEDPLPDPLYLLSTDLSAVPDRILSYFQGGHSS